MKDARIDAETAIAWYKKNRARTARLFDLLTDEAYYAQPITLRHPIVFYEGHLPAFSLNTLVKKSLGRAGIDEPLPASPSQRDWEPTADEWREALRACKGMMLRKEVYGLDKSVLKTIPYAVEQHNALIKILQPKGENKNGVFLVHESEAITYNYERNDNDPRIAHSLNTIIYELIIDVCTASSTPDEHFTWLNKYTEIPFYKIDHTKAFERLVTDWKPDIVVLDIGIPDRDGYALLGVLGSLKFKGDVIMISGVSQQDLDIAAQAGKMRGLQIIGTARKPVAYDAIHAVIAKAEAAE
jgi:CheY-like chemotaxis protein